MAIAYVVTGKFVVSSTLPSKTFMSALAADAVTGTVLTFVGLKGMMPLLWWQTLAIFVCAMVSCLVLNDAAKVAMIQWRVPSAASVKAVGASPQIARAEPKAEAKIGPLPGAMSETKAAPQPDAKAAPPAQGKVGPEPDDNTDVAKLMNTTLGDMLLAGVLKDPLGAGRIIAEAITHAETPIPAAKTPEGKAGPRFAPGGEAEVQANTQRDLALRNNN